MTDTTPAKPGPEAQLEASLRAWAREEVPASPAFLAELADIPARHARSAAPAQRGNWLCALVDAMGGWLPAGAQLTGMLVAAWLGVSTGVAANASATVDLPEYYADAAGLYLSGEDPLASLLASEEDADA